MLLNACKPALKLESKIEARDAARASFCMGYIAGINDAHFFTSAVTPDIAEKYEDVVKRQKYCIPHWITAKKMISVIVKFLENNPSKLHDPAGLLVMMAFTESFPCLENSIIRN